MQFDNEGYYIPQQARPVEPTPDPYPAVDWHALWADTAEDAWLLEPLIPAGGQTVIYSKPKVGKSLLMLEVAAALAAGRPCLGNAPAGPVRVLYVDHENRLRADVRKRLKDMGYAPTDLANLVMLSFPRMAKLDTHEGGIELILEAQKHQAQLVVIDTVSRTIQGEENANDTWIQFYAQTGSRLKAAGIAMVRLDHTGKDEDRGQRGGSAKSGDVDMVWHLKTVVDDEVFTLECEASRLENAERVLTIKRHTEPLRHTVDAMGIYGALEAKQAALLMLLDKTAAPKDLGVIEAHAWLRERGHKCTQGSLTKRMLKTRQMGTA